MRVFRGESFHIDIKASNILLIEDFVPQICDFGVAKWLPEQWTVSKVEGTFGFVKLTFFMHGIVDEKTDVFAFGVLLLELVTRRRAVDYSQQGVVFVISKLDDGCEQWQIQDFWPPGSTIICQITNKNIKKSLNLN
ncbi:hypothetical protein Pint_20039 [Pistacia integerrima]|uniref:Uncharacterized protein n=1 Tax=Pistacia integerrima TaxID=434235 RepID=A0ACC0XAI4_9ROSI|nr:hypothetical protein Pint_20039 [Pistacia integerrima]